MTDENVDNMKHGTYKHYFRRMGTDQRRAIIEHHLGTFPAVDVYELLDIPLPTPAKNTKFLLYYGHDELDALLQAIGERVPRPLLGTPLAQLLPEYAVEWKDDDSLGDVINDFLDAFFNLPAADDIDHQLSDRIKALSDQHDRTIAVLKQRDEWDDVRLLVRPSKLIVGGPLAVAGPPALTITPLINVEQLSYDALQVSAAADLGTVGEVAREFIDVMIVVKG